MAYMSEEGYKQLIEELKYLESVERPKIVSAIAEADVYKRQLIYISRPCVLVIPIM